MLRSVALKSLWDQRRSLPAWGAGLLALVALYVAIYPSMHGSPAYRELLDKLPASFRDLFMAGGGDVTSGPGYLYVELLSLMGPLLVLVYAIGSGAATIAGEEARGTFDLLLAAPVSRRRVLLEKFAAILVGLFVLMAVLFLAVVGLGASVDLGVSSANAAATMAHLGLLGAEFAALAMAVAAGTGRPAAARAVPAIVGVLAYLVNGLAPSVAWLRPLRRFSPFYQYIGHDPIRHGLSLAAAGVSVASSLVLVALAVVMMRRRDIRAA